MTKIKLSEIFFDDDFYPRERVNQRKVGEYIEAIKSGKVFPPIKLQQVTYPEGIKLVLIDGAHRTTAYAQFNRWLASDGHKEDETETTKPIEQVPYVLHSEKVYSKDNPGDRAELLLIAARYNSEHGYQMSQEDKKRIARTICESDPSRTDTDIAKALGISRHTLNDWVRDIKNRHEASQQAIIARLALLGWTTEDIGNVVGLTGQRVGQVLKELSPSTKLSQSIKDLVNNRGKSVDDAAKAFDTDRVLGWALLLKDELDADRLEKLSDGNDELDCNPRPYDVWTFKESHPLFGTKGYPGRIPGQIVLQLLYFFTEPNALVIDPCAGGGTVVDACLVMGRRCLAFDSDPSACAARKDIHLKDAIEAIKGLTRKADFIFLDTPYYKKMDKGYGENSISRFGKEEYLKFFSDLAAAAHEKLNKGGHVALLMSDYIDEDNPDEEIFIEDYINIFKKAGFCRTRRIHCDLSTQQIHPDYINKFTDSKRLAVLARDLVIFSLA